MATLKHGFGLLSKIVKDDFLNQEVNLAGVIAYNADKHKDTINEKVYKKDYLVMIKNFVNFCVDHKRVPAYITTQKSKTKVSFELYLYCVSKIVNYYKENKVLPNYCLFNHKDLHYAKTNTANTKKEVSKSTSTSKKTNTCTNPYTSKPHLKDSNIGQDTSCGCALNAQQQDFYKLLGKIYKESELAKLSGTTTKGTSHQGISL